jgi:hypothetical protein
MSHSSLEGCSSNQPFGQKKYVGKKVHSGEVTDGGFGDHIATVRFLCQGPTTTTLNNHNENIDVQDIDTFGATPTQTRCKLGGWSLA